MGLIETAENAAFYINQSRKIIERTATTINLPFGTTKIGNNAFRSYQALTQVNCRPGLKAIGEYAFAYCYALTTIDLPNEYMSIKSMSFYESAFYDDSSNWIINATNNTKALYNKSNITSYNKKHLLAVNSYNSSNIITGSFEVLNGTLDIASLVLAYQPSLTEFYMPDSVKWIDDNVCKGCSSLTFLRLSGGLIHIGTDCFKNCENLERVFMGNGFNADGLNLSYSKKYSAETLVGLLDALADRTGDTTYTLIIGPDNIDKLTAEQKAIAVNKNWALN